MSVGGRVAFIQDLGDTLMVATWEENSPKSDFVAVDVEKTQAAKAVEPGDSLWWQGPHAFWTPRANGESGPSRDIKIPRAGYSYRVRSA